jgi:hypothetical protein
VAVSETDGARPSRPTVAEELRARRLERAAERFVARWEAFARPPSPAQQRAKMRAAVYASAGRPLPIRFTVAQLETRHADAIDHALAGAHITITEDGERAAVMLSVEEYARLRGA